MKFIAGKRYNFYSSVNGFTNTPHSKSKLISALFTGEYDKNNKNLLLIDRFGYTWSIPKESIIK